LTGKAIRFVTSVLSFNPKLSYLLSTRTAGKLSLFKKIKQGIELGYFFLGTADEASNAGLDLVLIAQFDIQRHHKKDPKEAEQLPPCVSNGQSNLIFLHLFETILKMNHLNSEEEILGNNTIGLFSRNKAGG